MQSPCLIFKGIIEYVDGQEEKWACEMDNGHILDIENPPKGWPSLYEMSSQKNSYVEDEIIVSGEYTMFLPTATITETFIDLNYGVPEINIDEKRRDRRLQQEETGTRTVLAVRVQALNAETNASAATLSDKIFGTSGDSVNLVERFSSCSFNKLTFEISTDDRVETTADGIISVTMLSSTASRTDSMVRNAVTEKLISQLGTSPSNVADHVMYCLPPGTLGSWKGMCNEFR
mmetsp:Transcript_8212/g.12682  ORF Transcript_8212/g.12682 Transcript_8212/m.12682 type:complete len:232 (-) Transcript_8212:881-1576(-)